MDVARAFLWTAIAVVGGMTAASALAYPSLPDPMATHWNVEGEADGTSTRALGAFALPALAAAMLAMLVALPRVDPLRANYARFHGDYRGFSLAIVSFLAYLHALVLLWNLGYPVPFSAAMGVGFGALFLAVAALLRRAEPTWFVGIRTPWTLSNVDVWRATHRLGAKLFAALSLLAAAASLLPPAWTFGVVIGGALLVTLVTTVYSFLLYRRASAQPT